MSHSSTEETLLDEGNWPLAFVVWCLVLVFCLVLLFGLGLLVFLFPHHVVFPSPSSMMTWALGRGNLEGTGDRELGPQFTMKVRWHDRRSGVQQSLSKGATASNGKRQLFYCQLIARQRREHCTPWLTRSGIGVLSVSKGESGTG